MLSIKLTLFFSLGIASSMALTVSSISECPALTPRDSDPKDVTDLRIDDIKIVAGLGDSIMAGFGMMGVDYDRTGEFNISLVTEYRGNSYAVGGDSDAVTIPNFIKHYRPDLKGPSVLKHLSSFCPKGNCNLPTSFYRPLIDNLNSAQSAAIAKDLQYELDYLIPRMKAYAISTDYENDWKMITLQIGSNDQCGGCDTSYSDQVTPDAYEKYVEEAINRIEKEVPKVIVNLVSTFKVSRIFPLSEGQSYCEPSGLLSNSEECPCSHAEGGLEKMDQLSEAYNEKLQAIADRHRGQVGGTFAVMYNPAPINISTFPIDGLSNIDCFHPSLKGHRWLSKILWNQMYLKKEEKMKEWVFDENIKIYCPTEEDRLPIVV